MGNTVHISKLNNLVCQKPQCPSGTSWRRVAKGQCNKMCRERFRRFFCASVSACTDASREQLQVLLQPVACGRARRFILSHQALRLSSRQAMRDLHLIRSLRAKSSLEGENPCGSFTRCGQFGESSTLILSQANHIFLH